MTDKEFEEKLREKLDGLPMGALVEIALCKMRMQITSHRDFLLAMMLAHKIGVESISNTVTPTTIEEIIVCRVANTPGRLEDPRITELPNQLLPRLFELSEKLGDKTSAADSEFKDVVALVREMKDINVAIRPVYDWHSEIRNDMEKNLAELN